MPALPSLDGYVHSVETAGTVDGPGIRFVIFLNGCPLRCVYCHNPDAMRIREGLLRSSRSVLEEIAGYASFLKRAGGGVTISGGEPLVQPDFLEVILRGCKDMGLHTAVDTSGYLGHRCTPEILELTDLFLLDLKSWDPETHERVTGVDVVPCLRFSEHLSALGKPAWIRFVLVPGWTDAEENIRPLARHIATLRNVERVEILPFHKMGEYKWQELGLAYKLRQVPAASDQDVARARALFAEEGVTAW